MKKDRLARSRWYPELALFDNEDERKAVLKRFWRQLLRRRQYWLFVLAFSGGYAIVMLSVLSVARRLFPGIPSYLSSGLAGMFIGGFSGLAVQFLWRKPCQRYLREQLNARGVPICVQCGYDLRGQIDPRCPECGKAFDPGLIKPTDGSSIG
jgi:hypothetical protein